MAPFDIGLMFLIQNRVSILGVLSQKLVYIGALWLIVLALPSWKSNQNLYSTYFSQAILPISLSLPTAHAIAGKVPSLRLLAAQRW
jgi:hypothetical protein